MELIHNYRLALRSLRLVLRLFDLGTPQRRHCYDTAHDVSKEGGIPGLFDDVPTIWGIIAFDLLAADMVPGGQRRRS
jgi:hypothetical protein